MRQLNQLIREIDRLARLPDKNHHDYFTALAKVTNDYLAWRETSKGLHLPTATETQCQTLFNFIEAQFKQCRDRAVKIATTKRQSMTGQYNTETLSLKLTLEEIGASDNTGLKFESSSLHSHFENARDVANRLFFLTTVASASRRFSWFRDADHETIHQLRKMLTRHFIDVLVHPPRRSSGTMFWRKERPNEYEGLLAVDSDIFLVEEKEKPEQWEPHPLINEDDRRFLRYSTVEQQQWVWRTLKGLQRDNIDDIKKTLDTVFVTQGFGPAFAELFSRFRDNPKTLTERTTLGLLLLQPRLTAYWDSRVDKMHNPHIVKGKRLIHPMYQLIGQTYGSMLTNQRNRLTEACLITAPQQIEQGDLTLALSTVKSKLDTFQPQKEDEIQIKQRMIDGIEQLQQSPLSLQHPSTQINLNAIQSHAKELKMIGEEQSRIAAYYKTWLTHDFSIADSVNSICHRMELITKSLLKGNDQVASKEVSQQTNLINDERETTLAQMKEYEELYGPHLCTTHARRLHTIGEGYKAMIIILNQSEPDQGALPNTPHSNAYDYCGLIRKYFAAEAIRYFMIAINKARKADRLARQGDYDLVSSSALFSPSIIFEIALINSDYTSFESYIDATKSEIMRIKIACHPTSLFPVPSEDPDTADVTLPDTVPLICPPP